MTKLTYGYSTQRCRVSPLNSFFSLMRWFDSLRSSNCCTSFRLCTISNTVPSSSAFARLLSNSLDIRCWYFLQDAASQPRRLYSKQRTRQFIRNYTSREVSQSTAYELGSHSDMRTFRHRKNSPWRHHFLIEILL